MNKQRPDPDCNFRNIDHLMFEGRSGVDDLAAWRDTRKQSLSERCLHLVTLTIAQRSYVSQVWWHPWVRLERRTRAILADRLSLGASWTVDVALSRLIAERRRIARQGW